MNRGSSEVAADSPVWMWRTDTEYRVTAELPGFEERDVEGLLQDDVLILDGEKTLETEARNRTYGERLYGRFERQITLDREVDDSAVSAWISV